MSLKVMLATYGSQGDFEPFLALAIALKSAGHRVLFTSSGRYRLYAEENDIKFGDLSDDLLALMETEEAKKLMGGELSPIGMVRYGLRLNKRAAPLNEQLLTEVWKVAEAFRPDCIVYHSKVLAAPHIADKLGCLAILANLQPMIGPTSEFPAAGMPRLPLGAIYNRLSYKAVHAGYSAYSKAIRKFRADELKLAHTNGGLSLQRRSDGSLIPMIHAFSEAVVPRPRDWPDKYLVSGFWQTEGQPDYTPPPQLAAFLEDGPAPIYVGFGSMVMNDQSRIVRTVLAAVRRAGVRCVLSKGWANLEIDRDARDTIFIGQTPHSWLFPKMAAVVHHGGAGTTATGLTAGCPSVICPFIGDQPFWGDRVHALGAGPKPVPRKKLSETRLSDAIQEATSDKSIRSSARQIGEQLRAENGAQTATVQIEELVAKFDIEG